MNRVEIEPQSRTVALEVVHIESAYAFISGAQVVDEPKERDEL